MNTELRMAQAGALRKFGEDLVFRVNGADHTLVVALNSALDTLLKDTPPLDISDGEARIQALKSQHRLEIRQAQAAQEFRTRGYGALSDAYALEPLLFIESVYAAMNEKYPVVLPTP